MMRNVTSRFRYLAALWVGGGIVLAAITWLCFVLDIEPGTTTFVYLIAIVLLSLMGSFVSSAVFSAVAVLCLGYFFVEPRHSFDIASTGDIITLAAFLITVLTVSTLVRRVRRLADSHREQARLLDLAHDSIVACDMDGLITYWNRGAEELYGWKREEAVGQVARKLLQTVLPMPLREIMPILRDTGFWAGEILHTRRDGAQLTIASRWALQRDEAGKPTGMLEANTDMTGRKRAEEAVRRAQETYLTEAQQLSHTGSFGWNVATGEIFWSEESFRIFGYEPNVTPSMDMVLRRVHPDDLPAVRQIIDRAAADRQDFDFEHRLLLPDGTVRHLHVVGRAVHDQAGQLQFMGAIMDITARRKTETELRDSEQRYRQLFRYMPVALQRIDIRGLGVLLETSGITSAPALAARLEHEPDFLRRAMECLVVNEVNDRALEMFGVRDAGELPATMARFWRDRPETFRRALENRLRGEQTFQEETRISAMDGRVLDVLVTIARPEAPSALGINFLGFVDITERVEAQEMLEQLQAEFAHAARISVLGELTASIAHEVNQPLAAITTNGEAGLRWLNRSEPNVAKTRELVQRIVNDARRAADIIARIRALATGRAPQQATLSLQDVIEDSMVFLRHELQSKGVAVSLDFAPTLPPVAGDRTQLQQVIVNLAINAAQAMAHAGTARRTLAIRTTLPEPDTLCCTLEDSGPGIKPDDLERLFESFFTTKESGMGMGLPISRSIIEAHGGQIRVDNESAHGGARFRFTLPAANN